MTIGASAGTERGRGDAPPLSRLAAKSPALTGHFTVRLKRLLGVAAEIIMDEKRDGAGSSAVLKVVNGKYVNVAR